MPCTAGKFFVPKIPSAKLWTSSTSWHPTARRPSRASAPELHVSAVGGRGAPHSGASEHVRHRTRGRFVGIRALERPPPKGELALQQRYEHRVDNATATALAPPELRTDSRSLTLHGPSRSPRRPPRTLLSAPLRTPVGVRGGYRGRYRGAAFRLVDHGTDRGRICLAFAAFTSSKMPLR